MRRGSDDVGMLARIRIDTGGDQPGEMGHIHQKQRSDRIGDLAEALEIDDSRVGAGAGDDHLRLVLFRQPRHLVVVDALVFLAHSVGDHFVGLA